jgi:hypothetical protein
MCYQLQNRFWLNTIPRGAMNRSLRGSHDLSLFLWVQAYRYAPGWTCMFGNTRGCSRDHAVRLKILVTINIVKISYAHWSLDPTPFSWLMLQRLSETWWRGANLYAIVTEACKFSRSAMELVPRLQLPWSAECHPRWKGRIRLNWIRIWHVLILPRKRWIRLWLQRFGIGPK